MKRFRVSGLADIESLPLLMGKGNGDPHLGGQGGSDGLPAAGDAFVSELALDGGQEVVSQNRDEQVPLQTAIDAVKSRSEPQFALEGAQGLLHLNQHQIQGPEFRSVQVLTIGA